LGGIYSLRGYKARTVSPTKTQQPRDAVGNQGAEVVYLGGNTEVFGNTEFTFPLIPDAGVKAVVFFDYGNAYDERYKLFSSMLMSYGGGIRWSSPIGPLRLEYGIPINPRDI